MTSPEPREARAACRRLDPPLRDECLAEVHARLGDLDGAWCEELSPGLWRDECLFVHAERLEQAGRVPEAVAVCGSTRFGRECSFHLVRAAARRSLRLDAAEAGSAIEPYRAMPWAPDAARLFWKSWFRERLALDLPVDAGACGDDDCREGAKEAIYASMKALAHVAGEAFCSTPPPSGTVGDRTLWIDGVETRAWVDAWTRSECLRRDMSRNMPKAP